jgi:hypothetical protein
MPVLRHLYQLGLRVEAGLGGRDLVLAGGQKAPVVAVVHGGDVVGNVVAASDSVLVDSGDVLDTDD